MIGPLRQLLDPRSRHTDYHSCDHHSCDHHGHTDYHSCDDQDLLAIFHIFFQTQERYQLWRKMWSLWSLPQITDALLGPL
jgi:hypothetical protein